MAKKSSADVRRAVHKRIRKSVEGTPVRPRLCVYRSLNHIYAQVVDDAQGKTVCTAASTEKTLRGGATGNVAAAKTVGKLIAERALEKGVKKVVFDRGGYIYHGRVKSLADAAREAGLEF